MSISVADPGCLSRIPDPTFFHPGSRIRTVSIPDPGSSSKNLSIITPKKAKKWFLSSKKFDPGCSSRIRMLTFSHPGTRIQGLKKHPIPDPGSGSATLMSIKNQRSLWKIQTPAAARVRPFCLKIFLFKANSKRTEIRFTWDSLVHFKYSLPFFSLFSLQIFCKYSL